MGPSILDQPILNRSARMLGTANVHPTLRLTGSCTSNGCLKREFRQDLGNNQGNVRRFQVEFSLIDAPDERIRWLSSVES